MTRFSGACRAVQTLPALTLVASPGTAAAQNVTLDFTGLSGASVSPTYGTVPGLFDVAGRTVTSFGNASPACGGGGGERLESWPAYGGLIEIAYTCSNGTVGEFLFQPAAGYRVFLNSLQLASLVSLRDYTVNVYDAAWTPLVAQTGTVDVVPLTITPNVSSTTGLYLQWGTDWNVGIDNISLTLQQIPAVMPEPGLVALPATGLVAAASAARRRRQRGG